MPAPPKAYIICTSPRSGSTLLCRMLVATGVAGNPNSHFHKPSLADWLAAYGLERAAFKSDVDAVRAVVDAGLARGRGPGDVFGLRLQRGSVPFFLAQLDRLHPGLASDRARIEAAFGPTRFIHLTREDKLAQAVSRVVAEQTGLWHRNADGSEYERLAPPAEPVYDRVAIAGHLEELTRFDADWTDWFAREGLDPVRLSYESLSEDPQGALARVLEALALDPALAERVSAPTARLADATSAAWIRRFRAASTQP